MAKASATSLANRNLDSRPCAIIDLEMTEEQEAWAKFERRLRAKLREHQRQGKGPNDPLFVTGYPQGSACYNAA